VKPDGSAGSTWSNHTHPVSSITHWDGSKHSSITIVSYS